MANVDRSGLRRRVVFDRRARAVLLDRIDGVLRAGLAGIAFGPENRFAVIFEIGDIFASFVLLDLEIMRHDDSLSRQPTAFLLPARKAHAT